MDAMEVVGTIDHRDREEFRSRGFAILPQVASESEVAWLRQAYDRLFVRRATPGAEDFYDIAGQRDREGPPLLPQIIKPEKYVPELLDSPHFARCRSIASAFLDMAEEELEFYGHAILKPPRYGAPTPWHQDEAYMDPRWRRRGLSIWTTLDEATVESGCLHYLPGGHRGPVLPHHHIDNDDRIRGLMTDDVDPTSAVACPLAPGGAVVHDFRTPHYAGPNLTDQPRRAYVLVFMSAPAEVADPEPRPWMDWG
ncbi:phytanoyl-CoA dioxygenase family protein [Micromonospora carbonacea]|uniref:EvdO2 n=1 Tax=Micromonospora carbonacea TaxID=47853 RepID=A0A0M3KL01_9ACTN|nr:phytanoyl-CoA dioxygenase family protein [Micromonospora carbonacea]MBB5828992.1 ectoine hydroxylase-related dioxygenase (phytanoyl-CoA dioxygenase family) [Micromonospora carbonacea]QLD23486.1 phytanoyl-CoA dioxygenase family protein [Micromonospora carbonacea]4XAB_A Chain A, EvdO2 [Micromonospora carbonacea]4XAC_A Chain A, EvdO2 [Micromonospora carbonacea]